MPEQNQPPEAPQAEKEKIEPFDIKHKHSLSSIKAAMFGLAGVSVALILKLIELKPWDKPLTIAFYSLIVAVPLLTALAIVTDIQEDPQWVKMSWKGFQIVMILNFGNGAFVLGFTSFLWHYSTRGALVFLGATLVAFICFILFQNEVFSDPALPAEVKNC